MIIVALGSPSDSNRHLNLAPRGGTITVFIRLSAYLIFGLPGGRLFEAGWALIKFSPFSVSKNFTL